MGRFINSDDISYLDPNTLNGLNLYTYCGNNPTMMMDSSGHFAISILIGILIGSSIGFGSIAYMDYKDDGLVFNGSIGWQTYLGGTLIGGALGGLVAYAIPTISSFMGSSFTFGGGMVMSSSGQMMMTTGIAVTGYQVLGAVGVLGSLYMFASNNRPGNNKDQNEQFRKIMKLFDIDKTDPRWRMIHNQLNKEPSMGFKELLEFIKEFLGL